MTDKRNFARYELVGLGATVVDAKNKSLVGISGRVIDETRNTLTLENEDHVAKRLLKWQVTLKFKQNHDEITVDGKTLLGRSEDRLKKK